MNTHLSTTRFALRALPIAALLAAAACDGPAPLGPDAGDEFLTAESEIVLAVLADADAVEAGIALAEIPVFVTEETDGFGADAARSVLDQARSRFDAARSALAAGDTETALSRASEGRAFLADAIVEVGGASAAVGLVERAEALGAEVGADPDAHTDAQALQATLTGLASDARDRLQRGDRKGAVSDAIVAEQLRDLHRRDGSGRDRVDLALALGRTAIELAVRLLPDDPDPAQLRAIRVAERHLRAAIALAESGHSRRAVHQAELAVWSALRAVVVPGGVSEEEQRLILDLAHTQFVAASATDPEGIRATLLEIAGRLLAHGAAQLEAGNVRGIAALWSSAVISTWLLS